MRTVGASGLLLCAVSLLMLPIGLWGDLLGPSVGAHGFFALSMVIYGATFIPALSQGVLLGVHKNHLTVLVQTLFTATNLAMILGLIALDVPVGWVVAVPAVQPLPEQHPDRWGDPGRPHRAPPAPPPAPRRPAGGATPASAPRSTAAPAPDR